MPLTVMHSFGTIDPPIQAIGLAWFAGGGAPVTTGGTYRFSNDTTAASDTLTNGRFHVAGFSSISDGFVVCGNDGTVVRTDTEKYAYASNTISAGGTLTNAHNQHACGGNRTHGYALTGRIGTNPGSAVTANTVSKYEYATDSHVSSHSVVNDRDLHGATSSFTNDRILVAGGRNNGVSTTSLVDRYEMSTDTTSAGTALGAQRRFLDGCGNDTRGIFPGGDDGGQLTSTEKYEYAGDVRTSGGTLSIARAFHNAGSDPSVGILFGASPDSNTTEKYTFGSDTSAAATNLTYSTGLCAGMSDSHGGL